MTDGEVSELNIVLKSDVQGSCEAISDSLLKLSTDEVKVKIVGSGVGGITETDATLAAASNAIITGFNVRADASARRVIEAESTDLRYYSVIYNLIDEVKQAMSGMLAPEYKQQIIGRPKCATCSNRLSSALSPAVWLPKGPSSVTTQSAYCATT